MKKLTLSLCVLYFAFNHIYLGDGWTDDKNCNWFSYRYHAYATVWLRFLGQDSNRDWDDTFHGEWIWVSQYSTCLNSRGETMQNRGKCLFCFA